MTIQRMDNVLIVVDDLEATTAFFLELGLELEGQAEVEGPSVGRLIGLERRSRHARLPADAGRPRSHRARQVPHA